MRRLQRLLIALTTVLSVAACDDERDPEDRDVLDQAELETQIGEAVYAERIIPYGSITADGIERELPGLTPQELRVICEAPFGVELTPNMVVDYQCGWCHCHPGGALECEFHTACWTNGELHQP